MTESQPSFPIITNIFNECAANHQRQIDAGMGGYLEEIRSMQQSKIPKMPKTVLIDPDLKLVLGVDE